MRRLIRHSRHMLIVLSVLILAACLPVDATQEPRAERPLEAQVARIIDGDTLDLRGVSYRIRLWGIDTPERNEPGYHEASRALADLTHGQTLRIIPMQSGTDRYGRLVARLIREDGVDIGAALIESGHAREYCRYSKGAYGRCG
jgi:endonuclease YncB( thermonuclease family)